MKKKRNKSISISQNIQANPKILIFILVLITSVLYFSVKDFEFVSYDDKAYVYENPNVKQGLTLENIKWAFTKVRLSNWHPITWLSHMIDCSLFGLNAGYHHIINLLFHIANVVLLFLLLFKMSGATWRSFLVAILFAIHPLHVESVAWVAERKDVLCTFLGFLTILAYLNYHKNKSVYKYLLILFTFALGLMAKPMLVTLPFWLFLLDYWPLKRFEMEVAINKNGSSPN